MPTFHLRSYPSIRKQIYVSKYDIGPSPRVAFGNNVDDSYIWMGSL